MWGALISGGLSLLGGLFAKGDAEDQQERANAASAQRRAEDREIADYYANKNVAQRLVTEAESAGFNPLSVLRAGGLSAYGGMYSNAAQVATQGGPAPQTNIPSVGTVFSNAASSAFNAYQGNAIAQRQHAESKELLQMQLAGSLSNGLAVQGARVARTTAGAAALSASAEFPHSSSDLKSPLVPMERDIVDPWGPRWLKQDPTNPAVGLLGEAGGELAEWIGFIPWASNTLIYSATGITREQRENWTMRRIGNIGDYIGGLMRTPDTKPAVRGGAFPSPSSYGIGAW